MTSHRTRNARGLLRGGRGDRDQRRHSAVFVRPVRHVDGTDLDSGPGVALSA